MPQIQIQMRSKGAVQAIMALTKDLPAALARGLLKAAYHVEHMIKAEVFETFPEGRTGALARSFRPVFLGREGDTLTAAVKSDLVYARIQDEGGTITAKSGKYLAIPLNRNIPVGKWPRHFAKGELTFLQKKGGNPILAKITGKGNVKPMFALAPSVMIRAKNYLARAEKRAAPGVEEIIGATLSKLTDAANGGSSGG